MAVAASPLQTDRRRRHLALASVLVLLGLAGYANATVKDHRQSANTAPSAAASTVVISRQASSAAWYCPGPLPIGVAHDSAAVELANVSNHNVRGELQLVTTTSGNVYHGVDLAPGATQLVSFPSSPHAGWGAASVLLNGLGVGVTEIEHGATGPVATPCTTTISSTAAIAGGSTRLAANVALALFDPGATPAVANVSFATSVGTVAPPAFQGLAIGAGQLVVENVGEYLPQQQAIATMVQSSGGRLVVGAMDSDVVASARTLAFANGVATPERTWYLAPAPSGGSAAQSFLVLNTSSRPTTVGLRTASNGIALGSTTVLRQVGPGATVQFSLARDTAPGVLRWAEVTATGDAAIVVGRELEIPRAIALPSILVASANNPHLLVRSNYVLPQRVPPGETEAGGTPLLAHTWLLGGGESDRTAGEVVTIANPSDHEVRVRLHALDASAATRAVFAKIGAIGLAPYSVLPVDVGALIGNVAALTLVATATAPVSCGADLYARGSPGSVGFNESTAIPVE